MLTSRDPCWGRQCWWTRASGGPPRCFAVAWLTAGIAVTAGAELPEDVTQEAEAAQTSEHAQASKPVAPPAAEPAMPAWSLL